MSDLIYRQDAIDALNEYFVRIGKLKKKGLTKGEKAISLDTVGAIKTLPSAQPKTGKWIKNYSVIQCSECKRSSWSLSFEDLVRSFKYCPNCGAKMEGEEHD